MTTFATMKTYVAKRLIDPNGTAVDASDIGDGINDAVRYWKFRRFWFNEVNDIATLTAGSADFPYPSDFLVPAMKSGGFAVEYGGVRYPLDKISQLEYDGLHTDTGQGLPRWYSRNGNAEYQCYPTPDQDYTVRRHYLRDYVALSAAADTNDFTDNAERLIELWALANLTVELRQDTDMGDYYRKAANDEYRQLKVMTGKSNATGNITIHSTFFDGS